MGICYVCPSNRNSPDGMNKAPLDPRSVCNLMLDEAEGRTPVTNLALQKLLYFAHGTHLVRTGNPLVSGYFEAWQHGPVNPAAYAAFKASGSLPIKFRAMGQDPLTGKLFHLAAPTDPFIHNSIRWIVGNYASMTAGQLVEISHARGGPWDVTVQNARDGATLGLRIQNVVIREKFRFHKIFVGTSQSQGEPREEAPFVARSGSS